MARSVVLYKAEEKNATCHAILDVVVPHAIKNNRLISQSCPRPASATLGPHNHTCHPSAGVDISISIDARRARTVTYLLRLIAR